MHKKAHLSTGYMVHGAMRLDVKLKNQAKSGFGDNIAVNCKSDPKGFFKSTINKREVRSGIGPLSDISGNIVTAYQDSEHIKS